MCGIAGAYRPRATADVGAVDQMLDRIAHRGPDGRGLRTAGPAALGHVRLSVLDLSDRAAQPMASRDGRYLFTYNGEVYNFRALRTRLEDVGHHVRSSGDTEVLLEHLARFGVGDTLPRIEGFFAFALWDAASSTLTLARDRYGKKPVYWTVRGGEVRFASEQKALVDGQTRPDVTTLDAMLLGFSASWGGATAFHDIEAVEPGSTVRFRDAVAPVRQRWFSVGSLIEPELYDELRRISDSDAVERFDHAFRQSLEHRMVSDVPVASLVSGGVDSSLVTVLASNGGSAPELYHANVTADSELAAARAVARRVGKPLRTVEVTDEAFLDHVARATWHNDAPLTYHLNAVPLLLVCDRAAEDAVKVMLSGEGSDEFFLGYPQYGLAPYLERINALKRVLRGAARGVAPRVTAQIWPNPAGSYNVRLRELVSRAESSVLGLAAPSASEWRATPADERALTASLSLVQAHLVSLLHRNDRLGMAAGIENRFPFLGRDLSRLAVNSPARHKLRWVPRIADPRHPFVVDKWVVRQTAARYLPAQLSARAKRGFPMPAHARTEIDSQLLVDGFVSHHWKLDQQAVEAIFAEADPAWRLRLALVEVWGRLFFDGWDIAAATELLRRHSRLTPSRHAVAA